MNKVQRWAILWISNNCLDGYNEHFIWNGVHALLFRTRQEAREYNTERFGYIRTRPDLKAEPHGWKMPQVVRVDVSLSRSMNNNCK